MRIRQLVWLGLIAICLYQIGQARAEQFIVGTGTFLNQKGELLTNRHVIEGCKSLAIRPERNKKFYPARVFATSSKFDLAVIRETGYAPRSVTTFSVNSKRYVYVPTPGMKLLYGGYDNAFDVNLDLDISNGEAIEGGREFMFRECDPALVMERPVLACSTCQGTWWG